MMALTTCSSGRFQHAPVVRHLLHTLWAPLCLSSLSHSLSPFRMAVFISDSVLETGALDCCTGTGVLLVTCFLKYMFTDALNYEKAPSSHRRAEGTWRWLRLLVVPFLRRTSGAPGSCVPGAGWQGRTPSRGPAFQQVSPSFFWDFGSLHQKPRVGGTFCYVQRDGSHGWRSPVPRGDDTGGRVQVPHLPTIVTDRTVDGLRDGVLPEECAVAAATTFVHVVAETSRDIFLCHRRLSRHILLGTDRALSVPFKAKCPGRGGHAQSAFQCSHGCYRFQRSALC